MGSPVLKEKFGKRLQLEGWEETSFQIYIRADDISMACLFYFRIALEIVLTPRYGGSFSGASDKEEEKKLKERKITKKMKWGIKE